MWPKHQCSLLVPVFHGDPCIPRTLLHRTIVLFPIPKWAVILKHLCFHINDHPAKLLGFVIQPNPGIVIYVVKKIVILAIWTILNNIYAITLSCSKKRFLKRRMVLSARSGTSRWYLRRAAALPHSAAYLPIAAHCWSVKAV